MNVEHFIRIFCVDMNAAPVSIMIIEAMLCICYLRIDDRHRAVHMH